MASTLVQFDATSVCCSLPGRGFGRSSEAAKCPLTDPVKSPNMTVPTVTLGDCHRQTGETYKNNRRTAVDLVLVDRRANQGAPTRGVIMNRCQMLQYVAPVVGGRRRAGGESEYYPQKRRRARQRGKRDPFVLRLAVACRLCGCAGGWEAHAEWSEGTFEGAGRETERMPTEPDRSRHLEVRLDDSSPTDIHST